MLRHNQKLGQENDEQEIHLTVRLAIWARNIYCAKERQDISDHPGLSTSQ
jgi:hypothetical protein